MNRIPLYLFELVWLCFAEEEASLAEEALHGPAHVTEQQTDRYLLHVLSMGSKALMLQVWVNVFTGAFTFRLVTWQKLAPNTFFPLKSLKSEHQGF